MIQHVHISSVIVLLELTSRMISLLADTITVKVLLVHGSRNGGTASTHIWFDGTATTRIQHGDTASKHTSDSIHLLLHTSVMMIHACSMVVPWVRPPVAMALRVHKYGPIVLLVHIQYDGATCIHISFDRIAGTWIRVQPLQISETVVDLSCWRIS